MSKAPLTLVDDSLAAKIAPVATREAKREVRPLERALIAIVVVLVICAGVLFYLWYHSTTSGNQDVAALRGQVQSLGATPVVGQDPHALGVEGPAGAAGEPGTAGERGQAGVQGSAGIPGGAGATGLPGTPGSPGADGSAGKDGASGSAGSPGAPGQPGAPGAPASPAQVAAAVQEYLAANPPARGAAGPSGPAGPGPTDQQVQQAVDSYCQRHTCTVATVPSTSDAPTTTPTP